MSATAIDRRPPDQQISFDDRRRAHALQRDIDLMVRRTLDDLSWVMSYSRWKDPQFWPLFRDALLKTHPNLTTEGLPPRRLTI
jgi:hypothetical protein